MKWNALRERAGRRYLVAIAVTLLLAGLVACTTNYTPGNGQPTSSPAYGTTPHAATPGSSSGTEGVKPQSRLIVAPDQIQPMYSSSSEAIAVLAGHQGRFLGYANPGPASPNYGVDYPTGQVIPPALIANPQQTVNSSISSQPTPVITSGAGGDAGGGVVIGGGASVAAATAALTSAATATNTTASTAPIISTPATVTTPANAAIPTTAGVFAAGPGIATNSVAPNQNTGLLTPTVTSALTPSSTLASNPPLASVGTNNNVATTSALTANATTTTTPTTSASNVASASGRVSVARPIQVPNVVMPSAISSTSVTSPVTSTPVISSPGRARAVTQPAAVTSPVTIPGRAARPVRATTSSNGTVTITNQ